MITKSAHLHFVMCEKYRQNVINMGENHNRVFNVGNLSIKNMKNIKFNNKKVYLKIQNRPQKPLGIFTYHPVTLKTNLSSSRQIRNIFSALKSLIFNF